MGARRGFDFWVSIGLATVVVAVLLGMMAYNAAPYLHGAPPPAPLALLTHLVTPPALASLLPPNQAALAGWALAALMLGLAATLFTLALRSNLPQLAPPQPTLVLPTAAPHPPLPDPITPATPRPASSFTPPPKPAAPSLATPLAAAPVVEQPAAAIPAAEPTVASSGEASGRTAFEPWVFISHSSRDEAFGQRLTASLRAALEPNVGGRERVWYDQAPQRSQEDAADAGTALEPGGLTASMDYPTEIAEQIAARNVIIVVLSPEATRSRWVKYELSQAVRRYNDSERVLICPLIYRACATPNVIGNFQALNIQGVDSDEALYQRQVGELVARISDERWPLSESAPPFEVSTLPAPARLVGRDAHLKVVVDRLAAGGATAITALGGLGGIGKSALAAVAIRQLRARGAFPDGIVVVSCEGKTDAVEVLRTAIERFLPGQRHLDAETIPALASAALKTLEGKRALVVLDNVEPGLALAQVCDPLKDAGLTLLLTARQELADAVVPVDGVVRLELLDAAHALAIFTQTYRGTDATPFDLSAEERVAAERIVIAVDRHTLAVRLAGSQAKDRVARVPAGQRGSVLAAVAAGIERDMLGIPDGDTPRKVEKVLNLSVDTLPPDGLRLFTALAGLATGEFGRQAAIALARGLGLANPEDTVELLIRRALLDSGYDATLAAHAHADAERLRLHPLLRALAIKRLTAWPEDEREAAHRAIANWYGGYMPEVNSASRMGYLALAPDEANITGALDWALDHHDDRNAARLCDGMSGFWRDTGRTRAGLEYLPRGIEAATRVANSGSDRNDQLRAALLTSFYGDFLRALGRLDEAQAIYHRDLDFRRQIDDRNGEGVTLADLGQIEQRRGRLAEAEAYYQQSLAIRREVSDRQGEGVDLFTMGQLAEARGNLDVAETRYREGYGALRETQDGPNSAMALQELGAFLLRHERNRDEGREKLDEAIALWHEMGLSDQEERARATAQSLGYDPM